jgi:hypothetical protein
MALRIKAGGPTSVITHAEAKKLGIKTAATVAVAADKLKTGGVKERTLGGSNKEEKKSGGGVATT